MKKIITLLLCLVSALCLCTSCRNKEQGGVENKGTVTIGTMMIPGQKIIDYIKPEFEKRGYKLKIKIYTDFSMPNEALAEGTLDVNLFQHTPFLNSYNQAQGTNLVSVFEYYDCVYGGYTKKSISSVDQIPNGSKVTIASDESNMSRCLFILQSCGLITLKEGVSKAKLSDITSNPKNLNIIPMSTELIANSLDDDDTYLGLVNATYAIPAGLTSNHLLCQEQDPNHVNVNILAVRAEDKDAQWVKDLIEVLSSEATKKYINDTFKGTIIPYCQEPKKNA